MGNKSSNQDSRLYYAAKQGDLATLNQVIRADPNIKFHSSIIYDSVTSGNYDLVERLLTCGVKVDINHAIGHTIALDYAVAENDLRMVSLLLKYGANPKGSPLFTACYNNFGNIVAELLKYDQQSCSRCLDMAVQHNRHKVIQVVLDQINGSNNRIIIPQTKDQKITPASQQVPCPICDNIRKKSFQCGHGTCEECSDKLSKCPICRAVIVNRFPFFV